MSGASCECRHGARCQWCGASPKDGIRLNVDHIKPRKLFPDTLEVHRRGGFVLGSYLNARRLGEIMEDFRGRTLGKLGAVEIDAHLSRRAPPIRAT
jgi:hypothetical protein